MFSFEINSDKNRNEKERKIFHKMLNINKLIIFSTQLININSIVFTLPNTSIKETTIFKDCNSSFFYNPVQKKKKN